MRVALFVIIILLVTIIDNSGTPSGWIVNVMFWVGGWCLLNDYLKNKRNKDEFRQVITRLKMDLLAISKNKKK